MRLSLAFNFNFYCRYYVKGTKKGQSDFFVENLPGLPDNIRSNGKGGFYIVMSAARIASVRATFFGNCIVRSLWYKIIFQEVSITDLIGPRPMIRRFICRLNHLIVESLRFIESFVSSPVLREWIIYVTISRVNVWYSWIMNLNPIFPAGRKLWTTWRSRKSSSKIYNRRNWRRRKYHWQFAKWEGPCNIENLSKFVYNSFNYKWHWNIFADKRSQWGSSRKRLRILWLTWTA